MLYTCLLFQFVQKFLSCLYVLYMIKQHTKRVFKLSSVSMRCYTYIVCAFRARGTFLLISKESFFDILLKKLRIRLKMFEWIGAFGSFVMYSMFQNNRYDSDLLSLYLFGWTKKLFISNVIMNVFIMEKYTFFFAFSSMFVESNLLHIRLRTIACGLRVM